MRTPLRPPPRRERKKQRDGGERGVGAARWKVQEDDEEKEEEIKTGCATPRIFAPRWAIEIRDAAHVSKVRDKD